MQGKNMIINGLEPFVGGTNINDLQSHSYSA